MATSYIALPTEKLILPQLPPMEVGDLMQAAYIEAEDNYRILSQQSASASNVQLHHDEFKFYQALVDQYNNPFNSDDPDINFIAGKLSNVELVTSIHSTLADMNDAILLAQINELQGVANTLNNWGVFARIFSPIRVAINGFLAFYDIYRVLNSSQSTDEKAVGIASNIAILGLSILAITLPVAALAAVGVAMCVGFGRELYSYIKLSNKLANEKAVLQSYQNKLIDLDYNSSKHTSSPDLKYADQRTFLLHVISKQQQRVDLLENAKQSAKTSLFVNLLGVAGSFLLLPPCTPVGLAILGGVILYQLGKASGFFNWLGKIFSPKKVAPTEKIVPQATIAESPATTGLSIAERPTHAASTTITIRATAANLGESKIVSQPRRDSSVTPAAPSEPASVMTDLDDAGGGMKPFLGSLPKMSVFSENARRSPSRLDESKSKTTSFNPAHA